MILSVFLINDYTYHPRLTVNNPSVNVTELETLIRAVVTAYDQGVLTTNTTSSPDNWDFWSSFFFSATVVTTIGE